MNAKVKDLSTTVADIPERLPDFEVKGGWDALMRDIRADSEDYRCEAYSVYHDSRSWLVWRNL